jgi:phosphatidylglycerol:prolipoprotein diacylglycerol transferase
MLTFLLNIFSPPRHLILLLAAGWIGIIFAEQRAERHNISKQDLNDIAFYGTLALVIGGRISFVLQNLSVFIKSPLEIFSLTLDLFDLAGGLAAAVIVGLVYGQRQNLKLWSTLDALTPFFSIFAIGLGLSHLAAGTFYGKETTLPFGIYFWNATRHPTQIYETLAALLTLVLISRFKGNPIPGMLFLAFVSLTAFWQIIIQSFRADGTLIFNGIHQAQVGAWFVLVICFILLELRLKEGSQHG